MILPANERRTSPRPYRIRYGLYVSVQCANSDNSPSIFPGTRLGWSLQRAVTWYGLPCRRDTGAGGGVEARSKLAGLVFNCGRVPRPLSVDPGHSHVSNLPRTYTVLLAFCTSQEWPEHLSCYSQYTYSYHKGSTECSLCDLRGVLLGLLRSTCHLGRGWHLPLQEFAAVSNESGSTAISPEQSLAKLVLFISLAYLKKLAHVGKSREVMWKVLSYASPPT